MKPSFRFLELCGMLLFFFAFSMSVSGADFDSSRKTTSNPLKISYNNGSSSYVTRQYTQKSTDFQLAGTGLTGQVLDGGDHWILSLTGGNLNGRISSNCGVEIRLNGSSVVLSNTKSGYAIEGRGGIRIIGAGVLHIDQFADTAALYSPSSSGMLSVRTGAVMGINQLGSATAVYAAGIDISGAAIHVNSEASAFFTKSNGFRISASIVSAISTEDCVRIGEHGPLAVFGSSVHFISTQGCSIKSGNDLLDPGGDSIAIASSLFCAIGAQDGIQFHHGNQRTLYFERSILEQC